MYDHAAFHHCMDLELGPYPALGCGQVGGGDHRLHFLVADLSPQRSLEETCQIGHHYNARQTVAGTYMYVRINSRINFRHTLMIKIKAKKKK